MIVLALIGKILFCVFLTDFLSGLLHWLEDAYGNEDWPITGRLITRPNILHHYDPRYFTRYSWLYSARVLLVIGAGILAEGKTIYLDMVAVMPRGAASPEAQAIVERWRKHMDYFWTPQLDQLQAIANGYVEDARFKANFDKMHPQLAEFMREAVAVYVKGKK